MINSLKYLKRDKNCVVNFVMNTHRGVAAHRLSKSFFDNKFGSLLRSISFVVKEICRGLLQRIFIQSRCRNLREMKDVFKELKVLGRKRTSCTSQINKDILETIITSTNTFSSTILVTFLE